MADDVRTLLRELRDDLRADDTLQRELAASHALAMLELDTLLDGLGGVPKEMTSDALTLLRAAMWLTEPDDELDARFDTVARALRSRGARSDAPEDVAAVHADRCGLLRDAFADELTLFVGVDGDDHDDHSLIVDLVQTHTFELGSVRIGGPIDEVLDNARGSLVTESDAARMELVDVSRVDAGVLIYTALDSIDEDEHVALDAESIDVLALIDARARELFDEVLVDARAFADPARPYVVAAATHASELDGLDADAIAARFVDSDECRAVPEPDLELTSTLATWITEVPSGGCARVSPAVLDLLTEDLSTDDSGTIEPAQLPTLRAWIAWCARLTSLHAREREELLALLA